MAGTSPPPPTAPPTTPASRIASGSSVETAYARIREAIVSGEYLPGAPLRHGELSEQLGISLIPIREAMRRLEVERLIDSVPNKGSRVAPISATDLQDVYAVRTHVEQQALRAAWSRLTPDVIATLRDLNARLVDAVEHDAPAFFDLHRSLHFTIYDLSESPWLLHVIDILWGHTERYQRLSARLAPFIDHGDDLHHKVIDAIERGDKSGAARALRHDLNRTAGIILRSQIGAMAAQQS